MSRVEAVQAWMSQIRALELNSLREFFSPGIRILEIGGGNGFQANKLAGSGCDVSSIDLPGRRNKSKYYDVIDYDGLKIPFSDNTFDVIFSSNVFEHVANMPKMILELDRVLKIDGKIICIMPTPSWRFWTIVAHYPNIAIVTLKRLFLKHCELSEQSMLMLKLIPPPHGEIRSSIHELFYYSKSSWVKLFRENNFLLERYMHTGIFCTGYTLLPNLPVLVRAGLSKFLGSAGNIYIFNKNK